MYRTVFWTLWEKARVECFKRTASKHVYYLGWNRSPAQVGCVRQALGPGALGRPRGIGWRGRWEGGLGWGTHVYPWLIHFNVCQNPLQLKKKKKEKKKKEFACQCSKHGFNPWSRKTTRFVEQVSPCATTAEPRHSRAHAPQWEKPSEGEAYSLQGENARMQQQRPSTARKK